MYNVYEGKTIRLRPYASFDEFQLLSLDQGIELNAHWGSWFWPLERVRDDWKNSGLLGTGSYGSMAVERLDTGEMVGDEEYGLDLPHNPAGWIGTYITRPHQGQRFGVEAKQLMMCFLFENFPLHRLHSGTVETHLGAARGLKLCGMHYEGRHSKRVIQGGRYVDTVIYGISRAQWEAMPYRHKVKRSAFWYGAPPPGAAAGESAAAGT